ncbi:MAG TPA: class I SAM-dependent methyltransferase [Bacteroidales bacterium]
MPVNTNRWNKIRYSLFLPIYDLIAAPLYQQRKRSIELLSPLPEEKILILGAGTGLDLPYLQQCNHLTAIDITPGMIAMLKARARRLHISVDAAVMDGQQLRFPDESFDCIIMHLIIAVIPDPVRCIREAERVLKPGGRIIIFDKFLPDAAQLSTRRKIVNFFTNFMFSDITRRSADIINKTGLKKTDDVSAALGGMFRIIRLEK